ncbi:HD domain-containing protein [Carboxylicivirga caseinilyticus]|uniref:HD domain-containing protein n=1 Tax=Carboxylicivirga caseinilyticus TaxID=3417572 RepID=UPI003D347F31|nr:HD domain-containing protein [Marinilabiliaceae bacterium A049]
MKEQVRNNIEEWAKEKLISVDAGHDWWHIERVLANAKKIHQIEGGEWTVIELSVLLHDVPDPKFFDEEQMLLEIRDKLQNERIDTNVLEHIMQIISHLSFSKGWSENEFDSLEFRIVQDADRLDAIGAVGIARAFSYGGHKGRDFYDPKIIPAQFNSAEEYRNSNGTTINHFYEKLLLLKDQMKTVTGRQFANQRHEYMEGFLNQFYNEIGDVL